MPFPPCQDIFSRNVLVAIILGQILSVLICGTAVTSGFLSRNQVNIPTAQCFLNYFLLSVCYMSTLLVCKRDEPILETCKDRAWQYLILAAVDVEANYLIVKAYQYTTITSVQLLDCFTIPTVLLLSRLLFGVRYGVCHVVGVLICLLGVGLLILTDILTENSKSQGSNLLLGDLLCLAGAILYGISNVGQELMIRRHHRVEYLAFLGTFSTFINGIQFAVFERDEFASIRFQDYKIVLALLGFAVCLFLLYSIMPVVMSRTSATVVNLNLLSADFYTLLVGLIIFHYKFHTLYFVAFFMVLIGLIIFTARSPQPPPTETMEVVTSNQNTHEPHLQVAAVSKETTSKDLRENERLIQEDNLVKSRIDEDVTEGAV